MTSSNEVNVAPGIEIPEELRGTVSSTFSWTCPFGCTVQVVDGREQPHDCTGEEIIRQQLLAENPHSDGIAEALKPLIREQLFAAWKDGVESGRRGPCYGVDDDVESVDDVPPLSVPRGRVHAAIALHGLSTTWFQRVELTERTVTVEQVRTDPEGRLAKAGDKLAVASYTLDVTPDAS